MLASQLRGRSDAQNGGQSLSQSPSIRPASPWREDKLTGTQVRITYVSCFPRKGRVCRSARSGATGIRIARGLGWRTWTGRFSGHESHANSCDGKIHTTEGASLFRPTDYKALPIHGWGDEKKVFGPLSERGAGHATPAPRSVTRALPRPANQPSRQISGNLAIAHGLHA
jgi:hypothetical protein